MKQILLIMMAVVLVGCGMKWDADIKILKLEVEQLKADVKGLQEDNNVSSGNSTSEAANKLFVEARQLIGTASSPEQVGDMDGINTKALKLIYKIIKEYPEADITKKLNSGEKLFRVHGFDYEKRGSGPVVDKSLLEIILHVKEMAVIIEKNTIPHVPIVVPQAVVPQGEERPPVVIYISKDGSYSIEGKKKSLDDIKRLLKEAVLETSNLEVLVSADKGAAFGKLVDVRDVARAAGVSIKVFIHPR